MTKKRYEVIRTYTTGDFKNRVQEYCTKAGKSESKVVKEALIKLINAKKE